MCTIYVYFIINNYFIYKSGLIFILFYYKDKIKINCFNVNKYTYTNINNINIIIYMETPNSTTEKNKIYVDIRLIYKI